MNPLLSFLGFYESFFFTRKHPFSARLQEFGFSLCHANGSQLHTLKSQTHCVEARHFYSFPIPHPFSVCPASFPAYQWSLSSVTCFPGITSTVDTNDSPGFRHPAEGFFFVPSWITAEVRGQMDLENHLWKYALSQECSLQLHVCLDKVIGKWVSKNFWPVELKQKNNCRISRYKNCKSN